MAASSSSSVQNTSFKYDVFLSFRGEDTRTNFVDHLYHALQQQNIETYKDDENLQKGKRISKELLQAIEDSRFHVIVFSKDYASSSWCLDELAKIMECQKTITEHIVYPIFYNVEPTQVRKQIGAFGKAFAIHEKDEDAEKWREALVEATSFSGRELRTTADGHEVEFIKIVVKEISLKLPSISAEENLIGMRTRTNDVVSSLNIFSDEFCMIGITGMGGIGKTTLARAVFDQICNEFEGSSFVENVRESSNSLVLGLKSLQQQVLRDVLNKQDIIVNGVFDGKKMMKKNMSCRKVLVVLDDVDHIDQLKALAGEPNWFMKGSTIIITTRDKQILIAHKVNLIHDATLLTYKEAICLLSMCAFGTDIPIPGYEELSTKVVTYAAGLPLTITTLGLSLYDKNVDIWMDTLKRLEKIPLDGTLQKLELSYIHLEEDLKEIFLDVACILKGCKEDEAIRVLESCGFNAIHGLSVLKGKCLITVSPDKNLGMHDHIEEMGKHVVRRLHPHDPNKHSRLWINKEIIDILANNRGTEATKCIKLNLSLLPNIKPETVMKGLGKLEKLRFLLVRSFNFNISELDEVSQFPNSLEYLRWQGYPFRSLPLSFQASNLVVLEMSNSRIEQLWKGGEREVLDKLRILQLSGSKLRTLDVLRLTPNLEILDLGYCFDLVELHMPLECPKLKSLKLSGSKLSTLDLLLTPNIETLNLDQCADLVELSMPHKCPQLKILNLEGCSGLVKLDMPCDCPQLITLDLNGCDDLLELHMPRECPQLKTLNLEGCRGLVKLDMPCECPKVITLDLNGCEDLLELHMPHECPQLNTLLLKGCRGLVKLDMPSECPQLITLDLNGCEDLLELHMSRECPQLKTLNLEGCRGMVKLDLPFECPQLITLDLNGCEDLLKLHIPHGCPQLETLFLQGCNDLEELDMTHEYPQLKSLKMCCPKLMSFNLDNLVLPKLKYLMLVHSKSRTLELTPNLQSLILKDCDLVELHIPEGDVKLESLVIDSCSELKTLDLRRTPKLEILDLVACYNLVKLLAPLGGLEKLNHLKSFKLNHLVIVDVNGISPALDMSEMSVDISQLQHNDDFRW